MARTLPHKIKQDVTYQTNRDHWLNELRILEAQRDTIHQGGGEARNGQGLREGIYREAWDSGQENIQGL